MRKFLMLVALVAALLAVPVALGTAGSAMATGTPNCDATDTGAYGFGRTSTLAVGSTMSAHIADNGNSVPSGTSSVVWSYLFLGTDSPTGGYIEGGIKTNGSGDFLWTQYRVFGTNKVAVNWFGSVGGPQSQTVTITRTASTTYKIQVGSTTIGPVDLGGTLTEESMGNFDDQNPIGGACPTQNTAFSSITPSGLIASGNLSALPYPWTLAYTTSPAAFSITNTGW